SKRVLRRKLEDSWVLRTLDPPEIRRIQTGGRGIEIGVIQSVEKFEPQLYAMGFANLEHAHQAAIHVEEAGTDQRIVSCVAVGSRNIRAECAGVDPPQRACIPDVGLANHLRPVLSVSGERRVGAGPRRKRESTPLRNQKGNLPMPEDSVQRAIRNPWA